MTSLRVVVGSDQTLVAESVAAALRSRSYDALVVRWPRTAVEPAPTVRRRRSSRRSLGPPPDAGLVVSDLTRMDQVQAARILVTGLPVPWLVMAGVARGPAWGALYESGVVLVVPNDTGLDKVCRLLDDLASGRLASRRRRGHRELVQAWRTFTERRSELETRLRTLTDREDEVLQLLHEGVSVRAIAEESEVTEATVRSQVKSILRKLDVNSQMAAVAAYEDVLDDSPN
ncbi:helix-turn-helix transcriptional regulator [Nocardioides dilutus]